MGKSNKIYMDYAASAEHNPSSIHLLGEEAKGKLKAAREKAAGVLNARPEEIIFTSGGTESNNLAIQGAVWAYFSSLDSVNMKNKILPHIVTTNVEHPSVLETCELLKKRGFAQVSVVPVETNGIVDVRKIKKEIKKNTILVSVMYANNEIGTIQPLREIASAIRHYRKMNSSLYPLFHTDAVQAVNYLDLNTEKIGADLMSLSGSKIKEAGRVGVLYKKKSVFLAPVFGGGDQEGKVRPGTENLNAIVKFAVAFQSVQKVREKEGKRVAFLRDYFLKEIQKLTNNILINGDISARLPNILNLSFINIPSDLLVVELSARGVMASSKSACKSGEEGGSYVIGAIRPEQNEEIGGVRFSLGKSTTKQNIDYTVKVLSQILNKLEKWYN